MRCQKRGARFRGTIPCSKNKPGKTKAIAEFKGTTITLETFYSERTRWSQVQYLKLEPLAYSAWRQGHQLSTWVNAPCKKVAFVPLA